MGPNTAKLPVAASLVAGMPIFQHPEPSPRLIQVTLSLIGIIDLMEDVTKHLQREEES